MQLPFILLSLIFQALQNGTNSPKQRYTNAIELDLSFSKDNVIFLWHDPDPWNFVSTLRR